VGLVALKSSDANHRPYERFYLVAQAQLQAHTLVASPHQPQRTGYGRAAGGVGNLAFLRGSNRQEITRYLSPEPPTICGCGSV